VRGGTAEQHEQQMKVAPVFAAGSHKTQHRAGCGIRKCVDTLHAKLKLGIDKF
jgi:hypothetical protein